ncbi:MAG: hypothetical protein COB67_07930 [SAR324 cluster bacterium]|uniref:Uncharacterized protein n=1 Tax=SAR324 cluster bacterium TaxID=2024889 RepID=A0A2A4T301_9DELT|nr:MAG: hypothetical protein COB67_07930 [SAR324 cluster bacterium]
MSSHELINVANLSEEFPLWVTREQYEQLRRLNQGGWTHCQSPEEWMVKLHYLRKGYKAKKIDRATFFQKERELVLRWWSQWCR